MPDSFKTIPLTKGKFAIVDSDDFERLSKYKWQASQSSDSPYPFMARRHGGMDKSSGKSKAIRVYMHHDVLGRPPQGKEIDHKNGDSLDNRKSNLRFCTKKQNQGNRRIPKNNTSGYKGVHRNGNGWIGRIMSPNGKKVSGGTFKKKSDAALAYNKLAIQFYGDFARINVIIDRDI